MLNKNLKSTLTKTAAAAALTLAGAAIVNNYSKYCKGCRSYCWSTRKGCYN